MDSVQATFRPLVVEDFAGPGGSTGATLAGQVIMQVLGVGAVLVTPFVAAQNDRSAAAAGIPVGGIYVCTAATPMYLRTRLV